MYPPKFLSFNFVNLFHAWNVLKKNYWKFLSIMASNCYKWLSMFCHHSNNIDLVVSKTPNISILFGIDPNDHKYKNQWVQNFAKFLQLITIRPDKFSLFAYFLAFYSDVVKIKLFKWSKDENITLKVNRLEVTDTWIRLL